MEQINEQNILKLISGVLIGSTAHESSIALDDITRKQPSVVLPILLSLISPSQSPEVRQMASLIIRRRIFNAWARLSSDHQNLFKSSLLKSVLEEPTEVIRKNIAEVISVIGRITIPNNEWNELLDYLAKISESDNEAHRQVSMFLFDKLVDNIGDKLRTHFGTLHQIFLRGLQDSSNNVRIAAIGAVASLVSWLEGEKEIQVFKEMIPLILQVVEFCISNGFHSETISAFETFTDIVEIPKKELTLCIPDLAAFALKAMQKENLDYDVKRAGLTFIEWAIKYKPKCFYKSGLVQPLLQVILPMCSQISEFQKNNEDEDFSDDDFDDDDEEEKSPERIASLILQISSKKIPEKYMLEDLLNFIKFFANSQNFSERIGAFSVLGSLCEGYQNTFRSDNLLPTLLEFIYTGCSDEQEKVRQIANLSLAKFAKFLRPEIFNHYEKVIPVLFKALNDTSLEAKVGALVALECFCQELGEKILPFLEPLVQKITEMTLSDTIDIQEVALSALSATAAASETHFTKYTTSTLELMRNFINFSNKFPLELWKKWETKESNEVISSSQKREMTRALVIRGRSLEVVGIISQSVGKNIFDMNLATEFMKNAFEGFEMNVGALKEHSYNFFAAIASVFKEEFSVFAGSTLNLIFNEINDNSGVEDLSESNRLVNYEDEDEQGNYQFVRDGFLDDKIAAIRALGIIAEEMGKAFHPFLDVAMKSLMNRVNYFDVQVQSQTITSMGQILISLSKIFPFENWQKGVVNQIDKNIQPYLSIAIPIFISIISGDTEKDLVSDTFATFTTIIKTFGAGCIDSSLPRILELITTGLMKKLVCFNTHEEYDEEDEVETETKALIETACDCLTEICGVYGEKSMLFLPKIVPFLNVYTKKTESIFLRSLVIGTLGECCLHIGPPSGSLTPELLQLGVQALEDPSDDLQNNGAWFVGILLENYGQEGFKYYLNILKSLSPLFSEKSKSNTKDNACGCLSRMIMTGASALPLDQVLPVLLGNLPLKQDLNENTIVFKCLFGLFSSPKEQIIQNNLQEFFRVFAQSLPSLKTEEQLQMQNILKQYVENYPQDAQKHISNLEEIDRQNLSQLLN